MRAAASRTFCTAGSRSPIKIAMIAITTSNPISVRTRRWGMREYISVLGIEGRSRSIPEKLPQAPYRPQRAKTIADVRKGTGKGRRVDPHPPRLVCLSQTSARHPPLKRERAKTKPSEREGGFALSRLRGEWRVRKSKTDERGG